MKFSEVLAVLTSVLLIISCAQENNKEQDDAYDRLLELNRQQKEEVARKDSVLNKMMGTFNDIYADLRSIRERETGLKMMDEDPELQNGTEEEILKELKEIDELMKADKAKIEAMKNELASSGLEISELSEVINNLNTMLLERDEEIAQLEDELMSTSKTLGTLIQMYRDQSQLVDHQEDVLNTAYYIFGTAKELKEKGILTKEGGLAGLGGKKKLSADVDLDEFKKIDITKETEIVILGKDPQMLTTHPSDSYEWIGGGERLLIEDPELFWSISKHLVISLN